jgi:hypothetical protein
MKNLIVKKFEETVVKALGKYAEKHKVLIGETGLSLSLDEDKDVQYIVLLATKNDGKITGFNKVERVDYTSGVLFKKVDFTGQSIYVPAFIKQIIESLSGVNECNPSEVVVNIFIVNNKTTMYLYVKNKFVEILDLNNLLE